MKWMKQHLFRGARMAARDPVCHMEVDADSPPGGTFAHNGGTYYFCGPGCNAAFQKEPQAYLSGEKRLEM